MKSKILAMAAAAFITCAFPALAQACTPPSTGTQLLTRFGDLSLYTLAPGGSFEAGTTGWTLNGAYVQTGNEPYYVNGTTDSHSLLIKSTNKPVSAPICVSNATPTFRFFGKLASGGWGEMDVHVLWTDASGVSHVTTAGGFTASPSWALSPSYALGAMLPLWQPGSTLLVRLQFVPASGGGPIALDDVEVDPYSKG